MGNIKRVGGWGARVVERREATAGPASRAWSEYQGRGEMAVAEDEWFAIWGLCKTNCTRTSTVREGGEPEMDCGSRHPYVSDAAVGARAGGGHALNRFS